jgi:hypothetical protein
MKMLKKCIIAIAVVALLATVVQAGAINPIKRDGDWPWTYKALDICKIPVYMDVGHYVEIYDCGDLEIVLVQVDCESISKNPVDDFPCYQDCVKFTARANFNAIFGANLTKSDGEGPIVELLKDTDVFWIGDNDIPGDGADHELEVCINAWNTEIWKSGAPGDKILVGELVITVKPPDTP